MSVSAHQHRSLRYLITGMFVLMLVMSVLAWIFIDRSIEANLLNEAKDKNTIVALMIGDRILATPGNKLTVKTIKQINVQTPEQIIKSRRYSKILIGLNRYVSQYGISKINLVSTEGKVIFSTNPKDIGSNIISRKEIKSANQGEAVSFLIKSDEQASRYNSSVNSLVSFAPVYFVKTNSSDKKDVAFIVELETDVSEILDSVQISKNILISGLAITLLILAGVFTYLVKYSNNLVSKYAKQIVQQAKSDPVTGLLNRHHFFRLLKQSINKTLQQNGRSALLIVDIDHFKELNTKYDHTFGDEVLKIIVQRISRLVSPADTLARTGDDEFSILVEQLDSKVRVQDFAQKILEKVNEPIQIDANYIHLTASIGISIINQDAKSVDDLIQHADSALYNAKDFGRNNFQLFSRGGGARHIKFYEKQYSLNKALDENEFVLFIQPKIHVSTGEIIGGEILLRWDNPDYGLVAPLEFLPALEKSGLIHSVGKWVLQESCRICKKWKDNNLSIVPISLNVSALQFKKEDFVLNVSEALRTSGLDGEMLEIELTETCLMDNVEFSLHILQSLKDMGIRIAIDDFGTGYSSLNYLKRFPIDVLKIDRSFIIDINDGNNNENAAIVTAIMGLAHSLHLEAVAEGVETAQELSYLNALGCKIIQGFLFSKPVPMEEFELLLSNPEPIQNIYNDVRGELANEL